jgi:nitrite reductase/ring-hydroxylating ferredoxin subunit
MGSVSSVPAGERKIEGEVMIVNHKNTIYALNPKCPHLGLPMKTGVWCKYFRGREEEA